MLTTADIKTKLKFSILIVDDQPDNLRTLSAILRDERYTVRQAISGHVALDAVQFSPPDLILLDVRMPGMDGYEVCSRLKANPETCHIPVIFLSALSEVSDKVKAFAAGAVDYITKPFQAEEVLVRIGHQLTIQQQQQQLRSQNQRLQEAGEILKFQAEQERVMSTIIQRIRESLDKETVFDTAVSAIQYLLKADRVLIYQLFANGTGKVVAESVLSGFPSILGMAFPEEVFPEPYYDLYKHGRICIINDVYDAYADVTPCLADFLGQWAVKAKLVVPILLNETLWGLLIIHQCEESRAWLSSEVSLLSQLGGQIAIAIQQAELYQEIQSFNVNLEQEVSVRTAELRQALSFQAMLKRISDKVRDSLDSQQILQSVVEELAIALEATACDAALHSPDHRISTISYQYVQPGVEVTQGQQMQMQDAPELYDQLYQGHSFAFCQLHSGSIRQNAAILVCPIVDGQAASDVMGDLWVFKPAAACYNEMEIYLVHQVANQCAIALRQAQLYEAAQAQLQEQQRLNQLKDDFLSTISHELRTPIASIRMIARLLMSITHQGESFVQKMSSTDDQNSRAAQYLKVLQDEAERELTLIEDLLSLQHIEAGVYALDPTPISLQDWLPHILETFEIRTQEQQQNLLVRVASDFPMLEIDLPSLSRIITELLNNACKYTPPGESIFVQAFALGNQFFLQVENTGIEIAPEELSRIFDKFYRIPNNDPWKHGGTGLGLALVKKLVERMGGKITAKSCNNTMQFLVQCPIVSRVSLQHAEQLF